MECERFRSNEEDASDEGEQTSEEGKQRPGEGGRVSGGEGVADDIHTDKALQMFEEMGRVSSAELPEWMLRPMRSAVNTWAETVRNPGLNQDIRRRRSEFRKALTVPVDRWRVYGAVDLVLPTTDVVHPLMDDYFGAIVDFVIIDESRYEHLTAAPKGVLSPHEG